MDRKTDNYVYLLGGSVYINLTNKCHNACTFCIRNTGSGVAGTPLWLKREPTAADVIAAFDALPDEYKDTSREIVYCGYGEPTENLAALTGSAAVLKARGYKLRLNTNGLGDLINGKAIAPELKDIDTVSVSLNSCDASKYAEVTRSSYGEAAFAAMIKFATDCKAQGLDTVFTVVDTIGEGDVEKSRALSRSVGIPLRVRHYVADNYDGQSDK